ncbi:MAG: pyridoxamine 5'-phosphate oxidase family protein [Myxococcota bacterium]|nr:pyridoxamine 5'-phosphate oxidase family protein [Myxococcota bacterium]
MNSGQRRDFVRRHRTCVFGYERQQGPPSMSIVYYTMDGDDLLVSTMAGRAKAKAVERLGEVSICVLDEHWPLTYLVVYGKASVERDLQQTGSVMMKVGEIMSGNPIPEAARPAVEAMANREDRVVIRISPEFTFYSPPVHLNAGDDGSKLEHGYGQRLPWNP